MQVDVPQFFARMDHAAFAWLQVTHRLDADVTLRPLVLQRSAVRHLVVPTIKWSSLAHQLVDAYGVRLNFEAIVELVFHLRRTVRPRPSATSLARFFGDASSDSDDDDDDEDDEVTESLERDRFKFARPYVGSDTMPVRLFQYIIACAQRDSYKYPFAYIAILQSAGCGKSRLVRELAHYATTHGDTMRVLYTCMASRDKNLSAYPQATRQLQAYFFPSYVGPRREAPTAELATKLVRLYDYAAAHWDSVGDRWNSLFDSQDIDGAIHDELEAHTEQDTTTPADSYSHIRGMRILVLAIDQASHVFTTGDGGESEWTLDHLRSALKEANSRICKTFGWRARVFVVLVDANTAIADFVPLVVQDESTLMGAMAESKLFPPFVLTHTMDIRLDSLLDVTTSNGITSTAFYQGLVASSEDDAWRALVSMGRPLWDRVQLGDVNKEEARDDTIQLAADMLLGGCSANSAASFNDESLFGVASMLCRVGMRPSSWSPLAARAVAHFAAILLHTNVSNDQHVTTRRNPS